MGYAYVQVAMTIMADRFTEEREYRPFEQIRDNYPKYLLTRSDPFQERRAGLPFFEKSRHWSAGLDVALPCGEALLAECACGKGHEHGRSALRALFDLDGAAMERGDLPD